MINLNFGLWWSGGKLSYLRYLTFKSLRHFHPESHIQLFVANKYRNSGYSWRDEEQDFEGEIKGKDYLEDLEELSINVNYVNWFAQYLPNFQSDLFRWWYLKTYGGFYLDTDQIILKSFEGLERDYDLIYSGYDAVSCGYYTPVGVLGATKNSQVVDFIFNNIIKFVDLNNYNSAGPFLFREVIKQSVWEDKTFNTPSNYFYPVPESYRVSEIYDGVLALPGDSMALHWFGGHPESQKFNKKYTEEFAKESNDSISKFLREKELI